MSRNQQTTARACVKTRQIRDRRRQRWSAITAVVAIATVTLVGCGKAASRSAHDESLPTALMLADSAEIGSYSPLRGYGDVGVSPLYDGVLRLKSVSDDSLPTFEPALAAEMPTADAQFVNWQIKLRDDVSFHDGSKLDAQDVVATYKSIMDPATASDIASSVDMINDVHAQDERTVQFKLKYPFADFASRLLIAIAPSEMLTGGPAENLSLNRKPIGTGPYKLKSLTAEQAMFEANEQYWGGAPRVKRFSTTYLPDDNTRAQRMTAGDFDGAILPPLLAATFSKEKNRNLVRAQTVDWRAVSFPKNNTFVQDPLVRKAINMGIDRQKMVDVILGGYGRPAFTPLSSAYGAAYNADAMYRFDVDAAKRVLGQAGWQPGFDGVLRKNQEKAAFTLSYPASDILRRDLATAFVADMKSLGIAVSLEGTTFEKIEADIANTAVLLGGGDKPYSIDSQLYGPLHTKTSVTSPWDNPGNYGSSDIDSALERARKVSDAGERNAAYRDVQAAFVDNPSHAFLVFVDHTYVMKANAWNKGRLTVEPHAHRVNWGPWWNLHTWTN